MIMLVARGADQDLPITTRQAEEVEEAMAVVVDSEEVVEEAEAGVEVVGAEDTRQRRMPATPRSRKEETREVLC